MTNVSKIIIFLCLFFSLTAWSDESQSLIEFKQSYRDYQKSIQAGNNGKTTSYAAKSYELGLELFGEDNSNTAALAYNYALSLNKIFQYKEAIPIFSMALNGYEKHYGNNSKELIPLLMDYAQAYAGIGKYDSQRTSYQRALSLSKKTYGKKSPEYGQQLVDVGKGLLIHAYSPEAKKHLIKGRDILQDSLGENSTRLVIANLTLGKFYIAEHRFKKAKKELLKALKPFSANQGPMSKLEKVVRVFLVQALEELGESDEATAHVLLIAEATPWNENEDPSPIYRVAPVYPEIAAMHNASGSTVLQYDILPDGKVGEVSVVDSSGFKPFDKAAKEALAKFRFSPKIVDGKPVKSRQYKLRVIFNMVN